MKVFRGKFFKFWVAVSILSRAPIRHVENHHLFGRSECPKKVLRAELCKCTKLDQRNGIRDRAYAGCVMLCEGWNLGITVDSKIGWFGCIKHKDHVLGSQSEDLRLALLKPLSGR